MGNPFDKGVDVPPQLKQQAALQNLVAMGQLPMLGQQIQQQTEFQRGDRPLEQTFMAPTLVGPENIAYKAARQRALETIPEGGQLTAAMGQIESQRAYQDAAARQQAAAGLIGPPPALGGFLPATQAATGTAGQIGGIEAQSKAIQQQAWGGLGQLLGLGLTAGFGGIGGLGAKGGATGAMGGGANPGLGFGFGP